MPCPPLEYNYSPAPLSTPRPAHAAHQAPADAKDTTKPSAACPQGQTLERAPLRAKL